MQIQHADMRLTVKGDIELLLTIKGDKSTIGELVRKVNEKPHTVDIEPLKKKRSLDANAYFWVLCDKLANALRSTSEEVYRELVQDYGVREVVPIKTEEVDGKGRMWASRGKGWIWEIHSIAKTDGYTNVIRYWGSSSYDSSQMARLIDGIISECKEQGIETMSDEEQARLIAEWGKK